MIKDKITPEIKSKFKTAINKTKETGKEHGFLLCRDEQDNLTSTFITVGTRTLIETGHLKCHPLKTQGNFHTHADVSNIRKFVLGEHISEDVAAEFAIELAKRENIPISTPSQQDLMTALLNKCFNKTEGTVCIGSDADPNRVDCWTAKKLSREDCENLIYMPIIGTEGEPPKKWIKPFFDKEIIDLKK